MNRSTKFTVRNGILQPVHAASPDWAHVPQYLGDHRSRRGREHVGNEMHELQRVLQERARLTEIGASAVKIVHDLGNLLTALSIQAQIILQRTQRDDVSNAASEVGKPAKQILTTVQLLQSIVDDLRNFARDQRLDLRSVELKPLLLECVEFWRPQATRCGVSLTLAEGPELRLRADEVMLRRVLDNVIKNAIEAIGEGPGEVTLSVYTPHLGTVRIAVEDSGAGIPAGLEVFKLFETSKPGGTGIGLAVAKQWVTAHGGSIAHEPRESGGTRFCIELPLNGPPALRPRPAAMLSGWPSRARGLRAERAT